MPSICRGHHPSLCLSLLPPQMGSELSFLLFRSCRTRSKDRFQSNCLNFSFHFCCFNQLPQKLQSNLDLLEYVDSLALIPSINHLRQFQLTCFFTARYGCSALQNFQADESHFCDCREKYCLPKHSSFIFQLLVSLSFDRATPCYCEAELQEVSKL